MLGLSQFSKCVSDKYNKAHKTQGTYMKSLRCRNSDDLVQLLVCHPILQGIHLLRHEWSRTHLSVCLSGNGLSYYSYLSNRFMRLRVTLS